MPNEEMESPVEKLSEELHEVAVHARESWLKWSALLSAIFAVMAAVAGLEAAHNANDAMIDQIKASDRWNYYQAKGIKGMVVESEQNILRELSKPVENGEQRLQKYRDEQQKIADEANRLDDNSKRQLKKHEVLSRTVTLCQIAIAIIAIAVLSRRRAFVLLAAGFGVAGFVFLVIGLMMP